MNDTEVLMANLRSGPQIITGLVGEVPAANLKRRRERGSGPRTNMPVMFRRVTKSFTIGSS